MRIIKAGAADQSAMIRFMDGTTGLPVTTVVAATAGLVITYRRTGAAAVALTSGSTPAINDLAALTTAHTDAGIKHIADGWYRVDLPDDAVASGVTCQVSATATGLVGFGTVLQLVPWDPQATNLAANVIQVNGTAQTAGDFLGVWTPTVANWLKAMLAATPTGAVVDDNDPDPTATAFETNLTETTSDHYNGAFVVFYSGALLGQSRKISDYDGATKVITVGTAFTEAPANNDTFMILGRSE